MKLRKFAAAAAVVCVSFSSFATTRYVDYANGADSGDGTAAPGWKTLAYAVANAAENDEIVLAKGTHTLGANITIDKALTIRGEGEMGETIVDDNSKKHVITISADGAFLSKFTFSRLGGAYSSGSVILSGNSTISSVGFINTYTTSGTTLVKISNGLVAGCVVTNNTLKQCFGFQLTGSCVVENSVFRNNTQASGGSGNPVGVIGLETGSAVVRNCTVIDNNLAYSGAIANRNDAGQLAKIYNCIVYNNKKSDGSDANFGWYRATSANNGINCVNNCTTPLSILPKGTDNFDGDPKVMIDGLHIDEGSSCRGTAKTGVDADGVSYVSAADFAGTARGEKPCVGAMEYAEIELPIELTLSADKTKAYLPETITLACEVGGSYTEPLSYAWDFDGDGEADATTAVAELTEVGVYESPSVTVTDAKGKTATKALEGTYSVILLSDKKYYVDAEHGDDEWSGGEDAAWKTLAHAVEAAAEGDTIVLKRGTHPLAGDLAIGKILTICGEGAADETTIDDNLKGHSIVVSAARFCLSGVTLSRLSADRAVKLVAGSVLTNCIVTGYSRAFDGAPVRATDALVTCCTFSNNTAVAVAGVEARGKSIVENCVFRNNRTMGGTNNGAGVVMLWSDWAILRNCTIVDNVVSSTTYGALYSEESNWANTVRSKVYNNIIYHNKNADGTKDANWSIYRSGTASYTVNWVGNCLTPLTNLQYPDQNVGNDPILKEDRIHISGASPCHGTGASGVDADNVAYATAVDPDGVERLGSPSIGAYEFVQTYEMEVVANPAPTMVHAPGTIELTCSIEGTYEEPLTYSWKVGDRVLGTGESLTLSETGVYVRPTVTVSDASGQVKSAVFTDTYCIHVAGQQTYYVDYANGSDANDGTGSDSAFRTLAFAAEYPALDDGDVIVLMKGTHELESDVTFLRGVTVKGEGENWETLLTPHNHAERYVKIRGDNSFVGNLTFYQFNQGYQTETVQMTASGSVMSNVVFTGCGKTGDNNQWPLSASKGLVTGCFFTNNLAFNNAGMKAEGSVIVENCLFADNMTVNESTYGRSIVDVRGSSVTVRNCTIVNNRTAGSLPALNHNDTTAKVYNNIIWGNVCTTDETADRNWSGGKSGTTNWKNNCTTRIAELPEGNGNIEADPLFVDGNPLEIPVKSPCRNAGDNALGSTASVDILGNPRIKGRKIDIGCVEEPLGPGFGILVR